MALLGLFFGVLPCLYIHGATSDEQVRRRKQLNGIGKERLMRAEKKKKEEEEEEKPEE